MKIFLLIFFITISIFAQGQDLHFSQMYRSSFLINPAINSFQENDYQFVLQRRSQWESVTKPFNTTSISIERKNFLPSHSYGAQLLNDVAGDSKFTTTGFNFSYSKLVNISKTHDISLGLLFGVFQRSVSYAGLIFNEEENRSDINFWFPDFSLGISNKLIFSKNTQLVSGISLYHLNKPQQSLSQDNTVRLNNKTNVFSSLSYFWKDNVLLKPTIFYSYKNTEQEAVLMLDSQYLLAESEIRLSSGISYRWKDAIIYSFGVSNRDVEFIVSYDFNVSSFSEATNNKGGAEFVIIYRWDIPKKEKIKLPLECPKYM